MFLQTTADMPQPYDLPLAIVRAQMPISHQIPEPFCQLRYETIVGGAGQPMALRIYGVEVGANLPVVVWIHGGSFVRGSLDDFDISRRQFSSDAECIVIAVDQRLSPETQFPGPLDDALAALTWATENAASFGGNSSNVGIAGESSGGNIAAAACLRARDEGLTRPAFQILFFPALDATLGSPSIDELASGYRLTKKQIQWAYAQYAPHVELANPLISPVLAQDLSKLPPAVIICGEFDPLRDDGKRYAARLAAFGVSTSYVLIDGAIHHVPGRQAWLTAARLFRKTVASA